jgi:hypothetical protein
MKDYYIKEFDKHENNEKFSVKGVQSTDRRKRKVKHIGEEKRKKETAYKSKIEIGNRKFLGLIIIFILPFAYIAFKELDVLSKQNEISSTPTIKKLEVKTVNKLVLKNCTKTIVSNYETQGIFPNREELELINEGCED